jgi:hypothetical protein
MDFYPVARSGSHPRAAPPFPMSNFFPRWSNWLPVQLLVCVLLAGAPITLGIWYYFTPKYTRVGYEPLQPVPFSHALHAGQLGMDCRYCHSFVEVAGHANLPSTQTCINCHGEGRILANSPRLAPVRESWKSGQPIPWVQVHRLPDYAYFNHAAHVNRGVGCASCHGRVGGMTQIYEDQSLSMKWCLDCHRSPERYLRPPSEVFNTDWQAGSPDRQLGLGTKLKQDWNVNPPLTCGGCHR